MIKKIGLVALLWFSVGVHAEEATISIALVGDVMLDETPGQYIKQGKDPFKSFAKILAESDLRIANLECVVSGKKGKPEEKPYTFKAHPRVLPVLKSISAQCRWQTIIPTITANKLFLKHSACLKKQACLTLAVGAIFFRHTSQKYST